MGEGGFERPVSPRPSVRSDPSSEATPVRGETTIHAARTAPPPSPPTGRFDRPIDRYEIPVEQVEQVAKPFPVRRLITSLLVMVLIGVAAGWGYVRFLHNPTADDDTVVQGSASAGPKVERADQLVRDYLTALSVGDTELAMSLGHVGEGDPAAISPEAYQASLAAFPITDIRVPNLDNATTEVPASYRIGDEVVETRFKVTRDDQGSWELANATVQVELETPNAESMPVLLNGVPISGGLAEVLPGRYTVSTGMPLVDYPANSTVTITNLEYDGRVQRVLTPQLTDAGRAALLEVGQAALSTCLGSGSLDWGNCPNRIIGSAPYDPGSVRWEVLGNPWDQTNVALDAADPTQGRVTMIMQFAVSFTYTDGSTNGRQVLPQVLATYSGSMLVGHPNELEVFWSRTGG